MRGRITGVAPQGLASRRDLEAIRVQSSPRTVERANSFAAWLALIGLIVPAGEVQILIADAKFTAGRMSICLLFLPALFMLCQRGRRLLLSDLFACATSIWMIGASLYTDSFYTDGLSSLSSAGAEGIEFFGGYAVARAFFFGHAALHTFMRVLKVLAFTSIVFAMADSISDRLIVHDTIASIVHVNPIEPQFRSGMVRATSTFDHAILFGAFCSVVAAMLVYSEPNVLKRTVYVGLCFLGCILSLSSAGLMSISIVIAAYTYDRLMKRYPWRWRALWIGIAALGLVVMVATKHPLGWVISNLTLEPESGYFRLMEWDAALFQISGSPLTGYSFRNFGEVVLDKSVDSVWLAFSLRFGIPTVVFLILANVAVFLPARQSFNNRTGDSYLDQMRTAFTLVLLMFMFMGLTVHYWNYMWIFWGLCIGIRGSLREQSIRVASRPVPYSQPVPPPNLAELEVAKRNQGQQKEAAMADNTPRHGLFWSR